MNKIHFPGCNTDLFVETTYNLYIAELFSISRKTKTNFHRHKIYIDNDNANV